VRRCGCWRGGIQKLEGAKAEIMELEESKKMMGGSLVRLETLMRQKEKEVEQQQQVVNDLEKTRDSQVKTIADYEQTVRTIVPCNQLAVVCPVFLTVLHSQ